ncbi:hypothetical protein ES705_45181 [subsurface metagenome]
MKTPRELAEEHWETYTKIILEVHGEDEDVIRKCGVHYVTAMVHGLKHSDATLGAIMDRIIQYEKLPSPLPSAADLDLIGDIKKLLGKRFFILE